MQKNAREKYPDLDELDALVREEKIKNEYNKLRALYNSWNGKLLNNKHLQFKFNKFSDYQQATLIDIIQEIVSSETPLFENNNRITNKQIIKKLDNIDIDLDWSNLISKIKEHNYHDNEINKHYAKIKNDMKELIREEKNYQELKGRVILFLETEREWFINNTTDDSNIIKLLWYADICFYIVGQLLNYKILNHEFIQFT